MEQLTRKIHRPTPQLSTIPLLLSTAPLSPRALPHVPSRDYGWSPPVPTQPDCEMSTITPSGPSYLDSTFGP